jgi:hypothetical protein
MAANPTFKKREKERARQERQREKDAKRKQRREDRKNRPEGASAAESDIVEGSPESSPNLERKDGP